MATKIIPSLRSALERLKHGGAVNGLCLGWRRQVLINLLPFEGFRADKLVHVMQEAREHFGTGGREIETFWFGYEGVHVLLCYHGDCALAILHSRAVEADFLAHTAKVFLSDSQLLVDAMLNSSGDNAMSPDTQRLDELGGTNLVTRGML
jgi:hypothetical protein